LAPHPHRILNCPQPARTAWFLVPTEMLFLTGNPHLILAQHHNQAPNLTLTEIEIQSQKPATTKPSICLFIYTYTHHLILA
jgi:hypothetical protein